MVQKFLPVILFLCALNASAQQPKPIYTEKQFYYAAKDSLATYTWYADTAGGKPFPVKIYSGYRTPAGILKREQTDEGYAVLAGLSDFRITPPANKEALRYIHISPADSFITATGFKLVSPGRWLVKTGKWKVRIKDHWEEDAVFTIAPPFNIVVDNIYDFEVRPGTGNVILSKKDIDAGIRE